jgi:predicted dehydrogenase
MSYKACVIGCGRIGFGFDKDPKRKYVATHTGAYSFIKGINLVAVCDKSKKRLKECIDKLAVPRGYIDCEEMLMKEEIDVLSICTPPDTHYSILKKAAQFPVKAIFCEKPLADNLKNAIRMVNLCKEKKIILQVDHQRRFDPLHINLRELVKNKELGDVQQVNFYYTAGVKNTGSHMFDLFGFFLGEAEWIEAFFSKNKSHKDNDPNLDGIIKFKNGVLAAFHACDVKKYLIFELNCTLDKGRFSLKDSGFSVDFYTVEDSKHFSGYKELKKRGIHFDTKYKRNFMVNGVKHLLECIKSKKESISSGADGAKVLELINAGVTSANNNGKRIFIR